MTKYYYEVMPYNDVGGYSVWIEGVNNSVQARTKIKELLKAKGIINNGFSVIRLLHNSDGSAEAKYKAWARSSRCLN